MSDPQPEPGMDEGPLPVATPEEEAAVVQGLNTENHPDNEGDFEEPPLSADEQPEEPVSDEELDQAMVGVDPDAVDLTGHDENDLVIEPMTGVTIPEELGELPDPELDESPTT
jgi:hypothetical protein